MADVSAKAAMIAKRSMATGTSNKAFLRKRGRQMAHRYESDLRSEYEGYVKRHEKEYGKAGSPSHLWKAIKRGGGNPLDPEGTLKSYGQWREVIEKAQDAQGDPGVYDNTLYFGPTGLKGLIRKAGRTIGVAGKDIPVTTRGSGQTYGAKGKIPGVDYQGAPVQSTPGEIARQQFNVENRAAIQRSMQERGAMQQQGGPALGPSSTVTRRPMAGPQQQIPPPPPGRARMPDYRPQQAGGSGQMPQRVDPTGTGIPRPPQGRAETWRMMGPYPKQQGWHAPQRFPTVAETMPPPPSGPAKVPYDPRSLSAQQAISGPHNKPPPGPAETWPMMSTPRVSHRWGQQVPERFPTPEQASYLKEYGIPHPPRGLAEKSQMYQMPRGLGGMTPRPPQRFPTPAESRVQPEKQVYMGPGRSDLPWFPKKPPAMSAPQTFRGRMPPTPVRSVEGVVDPLFYGKGKTSGFDKLGRSGGSGEGQLIADKEFLAGMKTPAEPPPKQASGWGARIAAAKKPVSKGLGKVKAKTGKIDEWASGEPGELKTILDRAKPPKYEGSADKPGLVEGGGYSDYLKSLNKSGGKVITENKLKGMSVEQVKKHFKDHGVSIELGDAAAIKAGKKGWIGRNTERLVKGVVKRRKVLAGTGAGLAAGMAAGLWWHDRSLKKQEEAGVIKDYPKMMKDLHNKLVNAQSDEEIKKIEELLERNEKRYKQLIAKRK